MQSGLLVSLVVSLAVSSSCGLRVPLSRRDAPHSTSVNFTAIEQSTPDPFNFVKKATAYDATVEIEGQSFVLVLDTGSADLWIQDTLGGVAYTGQNVSLSYGDGSTSSGPVVLGNVTLGNFNVEKQALLFSPDAQFSGSGEEQGILGVGGRYLSEIYQTLENTSYDGSTFLDHVFSLYPNESNYITFLLDRSDVGTSSGGVFTISEIVPEVSDILSAPKLKVVEKYSDILNASIPAINEELGEWFTLMDAMEVNGVTYSGNSPLLLNNITTGQTLVLLDTGTTYGLAPPYYVDALYKNVSGAVFDGVDTYNIPCDTKLNVSMVFNNVSYAVHPIDLVLISGIDNSTGTFICSGAFSYSSIDNGVDFILGDAFLRNVYALYDFGYWTPVGTTPPYMQILGITDPDTAWAEFDTLYKARFDEYFFAALEDGDSPTVTETVYLTYTPSPPAIPTPIVTATSFTTITLSSVSTPSTSVTGQQNAEKPPSQNFALDGALADSTPSPASTSDNSALLRNSYILIGLASGAVVLLLVLLIMSFARSRSTRGYAPVREAYKVPVAVDKPYSAEASYSDRYPDPYDEGQ